jgi:hypothetical protein
MSEAHVPGAKSDVIIDRLVLSLPGMDAAAARALALGIAEGLSEAGLTGEHAPAPVSVEPLSGEPAPRLAARIVETLLRQIG